MVRFYSVLAFVLTGLAMGGCGGETAGPGNEALDPFNLWTWSNESTYGQFYTTSQWAQASGAVHYISGGQIFKTTGHDTLVSGGNMVASGLPVPSSSPGDYQTFSPSTFGSVTTWSLSGNSGAGIPGFTDTMYIPAEIRITTPSATTSSISRSAPLVVAWNADANNDVVLINVEYLVDASQLRDSTLPGTDYKWHTTTEDDGSYTISTTDLAGLPVGGVVEITLARGVSKTTGTSSKKFHIYAYSTAAAVYKITL